MTAIVTGGSSGIGEALAQRLRLEGGHVVIVDRVAPRDRSFDDFENIDLRVESEVVAGVAAIEKRCGRIAILANCAGIGLSSPLLDTSLDNWNAVLDVNLTGMFLMCREVGRIMVRARAGSIVNVASIDAHAADPSYGSYNTSKAGVLGLTRSLAIELAEFGVRANSVSPGLVVTPMIQQGSAANDVVNRHILTDFKRVPMRRVMQPQEVAAACAYMLSDDASGVTGSDLIIDGGMMADSYLMRSLPS